MDTRHLPPRYIQWIDQKELQILKTIRKLPKENQKNLIHLIDVFVDRTKPKQVHTHT